MQFIVKPVISDCGSLRDFLTQWKVGENDLIVTNEYVLSPQLGGEAPPCDAVYQEKYGSGEPSDEMVDKMLAAASKREYARIIAIGGGTVIDIAKLMVFKRGLSCEEIFERGAALVRHKKLIVIPTTCGTGSECTSISIIEFKKKQTKLGLSVSALYPDEAVLISGLLKTLPYDVFAASSIDALIHAMESFVSPKASYFTRALGASAIQIIIQGHQALAAKGGNRQLPEDIRGFLAASTMAGISFGNAGCAAVHALSYPIGGTYHVPHGKANYLLLGAVFRTYRELNADLSALEGVFAPLFGCEKARVWDALDVLLQTILPLQKLSALGMGEAECKTFAQSVVRNQQRLLGNNPVSFDEQIIENLYLSCL